MAKSSGKLFEEEVKTSCMEQNIWFFRVRDVNIPPDLRMKIRIPENPYDSLIFKEGILLPCELKSTKGKSLPFKNIKQHQIDSLIESNTYKQVIPGFLISFRDLGRSFYLHIDDFLNCWYNSTNGEKEYKNVKLNKSSIRLEYCEVFGIEITGYKKKVKYRWYINQMIDEVVKKYGE